MYSSFFPNEIKIEWNGSISVQIGCDDQMITGIGLVWLRMKILT